MREREADLLTYNQYKRIRTEERKADIRDTVKDAMRMS